MTLQALLDALPDDDVVGQVQTAGIRAFVQPDGSRFDAPLWLIGTPRRTWLAAFHQGQLKAVAHPRPVLHKGWVTDTVKVGPWSAPLRPATRASVQALLARTAEGPRDGAPVPLPAGVPFTPGPHARGSSLPDGFAVAAEPDDAWLIAAETASEQPFDRPDGTVSVGAVHLAVSGRKVALWAKGPDGTWSMPVHELALTERTGADRLLADGRVLWGPRLRPEALRLAARLATLPEGDRWVQLARAWVETDPRRATRVVAEAIDRGHTRAWEVAARLLCALGDLPRSLAATARLLQLHPDHPVTALDWHPAVDKKALLAGDVDLHALRATLRAQLGALEPTPELEGFPLRSPLALWITALAAVGRATESFPWTERLPAADRTLAAAALHSVLDGPEAAPAWALAADAHRAGAPAEAADLLDRALARQPTAPWAWRRGAWAWADHDPVAARRAWTLAMDLDPEASQFVPLPVDAERALLSVADDEGHLPHAAAAARRLAALLPDDPDAAHQAVERTAPLDLPLAADVQARWCGHADDLPDPPQPRARRWLRLAELARAAGRKEQAADALREAVRGDFLRPEVTADAIRLGVGLDLPVSWWEHVRGVLVGAPAGAPRAPVERLDAASLDALHPGGTGWLDAIKARLQVADTPPRSELIRGLERLVAEDHPDADRAVDEVTRALDLSRPEVYLFRGDGAFGCSAWPTDPPLLLLGVEHLRPGPRQLGPTALRALLAVELVHLACGHPLLPHDVNLVGSAYAVFGRYASTAENVMDLVTLVPGVDQIAKLQTVFLLSKRVFSTRSRVDKVSSLARPVLERLGVGATGTQEGVGRQVQDGAALQFRIQADRAALRLCGDLAATVEAVLRSGPRPELADRAREEGLLAVLGESGQAVRLTALVQEAMG